MKNNEIEYCWLIEMDVNVRLITDINRLVQQLTGRELSLDLEEVVEIATQPNAHVLIATCDHARVVGMGLLIEEHTFSGRFGRIKDVVVSEKCPDPEVWTELNVMLSDRARSLGLSIQELKPRPGRLIDLERGEDFLDHLDAKPA